MFDTNIVIVGNVLTAPEWRRTTNTNSLVANFKVASTARRLDRESGRWVDGNSLRVRVNCWRKLAEGVASSVMVGDPIVVVGRLYTRDWTDSEGNPRTMYEMEAVAVGHDLARGRAKFQRNRPTAGTSAVDSPEADAQVRGEHAEPVSEGEVPARYGEGLFEDGDPTFAEVPPTSPGAYDPVASVRGGGFEPYDTALTTPLDDDLAPYGEGTDPESADSDTPVPADGEPATDDEPPADLGEPAATGGTRRPRRNGRKVPVPA